MGLSYDDIAEILKIIDASSCDELIVETGDLKLVIRRNGAGDAYSPSHNVVSSTAGIPSPPKTGDVAPAANPALHQLAPKAPHQIEVIAPMVGLLKSLEGMTDLPHVPYRGAGPALADLIGGQIRILVSAMTSQVNFIAPANYACWRRRTALASLSRRRYRQLRSLGFQD